MSNTSAGNKIIKFLALNLKSIKENNEEFNKQGKFAEFLGISPSFLSEILKCKAKVSLDMLENIAKKVGRPASKLIEKPERRNLSCIKTPKSKLSNIKK